jgi:hypothetical protein
LAIHLSDNSTTWKETENRTRKRIEGGLEISAANYADHAENTISKLKATNSKIYRPQQYFRSIGDVQISQDIPNNRFRGQQDYLEHSEPEGGIAK